MSLPRCRFLQWSLVLVSTISFVGAASSGGLEYKVDGESFAMERRPEDVDTVKRPVVVLLHGVDGLSELSRPQILAFAEELAKAGYLAVVPTYFGAKDGPVDKFPDPKNKDIAARIGRVNEYGLRVAKAVEVARDQKDADRDRVALVGFSLGGGLALERAEASTGEIRAAVDFFGYIGSDLIYKEVAKLPPTVVFHNPKDAVVDADYSRRVLEALGKTTVPHEGHFFVDDNPLAKDHPFKRDGDADKKSRELTLKWLAKYLKP